MSDSVEQSNNSNDHDSHFDIVIVGAGMVGLSLACALSAPLSKGLPRKELSSPRQNPLRIAIIDRHPIQEKEQWQGKDPRVSAVVKSSQNFLDNVGAWQYIQQESCHAYTGMDVWEKDGTASIQFDCADIAYPELGHIVENRVLQRGMYDCLLERGAQIEWFFSDEMRSIEKKESNTISWHLNFNSGKTLTAQLLIGADGPMSYVRGELEIELNVKNLEQKAIVCHVESALAHDNIARQIFLPSGPLAFLPLANNMANHCGSSSIVWSADHKKADKLMAMSESEFNAALAKAFEGRLGKIKSSDKRFCFPLYQRNAKSYISKYAALIGDAAHTIHPLAGQGVNLGFMDAAVLAEEIERALNRGVAINSREVLRRYERRRRGQVTLMMESMRAFQTIYSTKHADLIGLRNLGVKLINKNNPIKNSVLSHAMGVVGDLPESARKKY